MVQTETHIFLHLLCLNVYLLKLFFTGTTPYCISERSSNVGIYFWHVPHTHNHTPFTPSLSSLSLLQVYLCIYLLCGCTVYICVLDGEMYPYVNTYCMYTYYHNRWHRHSRAVYLCPFAMNPFFNLSVKWEAVRKLASIKIHCKNHPKTAL